MRFESIYVGLMWNLYGFMWTDIMILIWVYMGLYGLKELFS